MEISPFLWKTEKSRFLSGVRLATQVQLLGCCSSVLENHTETQKVSATSKDHGYQTCWVFSACLPPNLPPPPSSFPVFLCFPLCPWRLAVMDYVTQAPLTLDFWLDLASRNHSKKLVVRRRERSGTVLLLCQASSPVQTPYIVPSPHPTVPFGQGKSLEEKL